MKKFFLALAAILFISASGIYAQTPVTTKAALEGVFVFSNPVPIYEGALQVATEYSTDCMWKPHAKRCRQKDGNCTKGHTKFDMSDELLEATLVIPGEEVDVETAPQVPVSLSLGEEDYGEGNEVTIYIDELE